MKLLLFFLLFSSLYSKNFTVASYNVENLFDMQKNGSEYESYVPNKHNWKEATLKKKLLHLSEVICDINADIIGLQEVENENVLKLLQHSLRKVGCNYKFSAITHKKKSAIQVALLSKIPIIAKREIVVNKRVYYRPILKVKLLVEGRGFYVYVNHWSSKRSAEKKRLLSAKVLKKELLKLPKNSDYILLGDFNSDYNEYRHFERKFNNTHGVVGINHLLKTVKQGKLYGKLDAKLVRVNEMDVNEFKHYNLWLELPNYRRWSHNFYGQKEALDSILLPPSLFNGKGIDYLNNSFRVIRFNYLFTKKGYVNRWQYKHKRHLGRGYSDHLPIVATFSTRPYWHDIKRERVMAGTINDLYAKELTHSIYLTRVKVVSKERALAKLSQKGKSIYLYGAKELKEGSVYDLTVHQVKNYKGLQEIIDFTIEKEYHTKNLKN